MFSLLQQLLCYTLAVSIRCRCRLGCKPGLCQPNAVVGCSHGGLIACHRQASELLTSCLLYSWPVQNLDGRHKAMYMPTGWRLGSKACRFGVSSGVVA